MNIFHLLSFFAFILANSIQAPPTRKCGLHCEKDVDFYLAGGKESAGVRPRGRLPKSALKKPALKKISEVKDYFIEKCWCVMELLAPNCLEPFRAGRAGAPSR
ncbi:MAG: hypothetical protein ACM3PY_18575, partial [Omnitrophica WOR_2 bacterium]